MQSKFSVTTSNELKDQFGAKAVAVRTESGSRYVIITASQLDVPTREKVIFPVNIVPAKTGSKPSLFGYTFNAGVTDLTTSALAAIETADGQTHAVTGSEKDPARSATGLVAVCK